MSSQSKTPYEVFNVGTGLGSSVLEVIKAFESSTGEKLNFKIVDRRAGDVIAAFADTSKANDILGWKAERSLEQALKDAWEWEKTQTKD
jgi:UDP-glucose 4-epimerase